MFDRPILATDLDGTFIPLAGNERNRRDLLELTSQRNAGTLALVFVTGRHQASVLQAIDEFSLPQPDWIICDVGTTILQPGNLHPLDEFQQHQAEIIRDYPRDLLAEQLQKVPGLVTQEPEKQGPYKLSYYAPEATLPEIVTRIEELLLTHAIPWRLIASVDPFKGGGMVDLLPQNVSKAYALEWWLTAQSLSAESLVFAGDSGNDYAALTAGFRAILVGNADRELALQVQAEHRRRGFCDRLHLAEHPATSGVLEGCKAFGVIPPTP